MYLNRELSLLDFNRRVLENAEDPSIPLLERLKFLCISSTNIDEFFEVRVAGLKQKAMAGLNTAEPDNLKPNDTLKRISEKAHALVAEQYRVLNEVLRDALKAEDIHLLTRDTITDAQRIWMRDYFRSELLPVLSPVGLDPSHPFPRVLNKSLNFIVSLQGKDAFGRNVDVAIVPAPRSLPRLVRLPESVANYSYEFASLALIIRSNVEELFPDMTLTGSYQFRVTRNSNLFFDEEEIDDLLITLEGELPSRRYGDAVRLEIEDSCPESLYNFLLEHFGLDTDDLYRVNGPVNLNRLSAITELVERKDLKYPPFAPGFPEGLNTGIDMFEAIRKNDILVHHPFESFTPVIDFLRNAANDPNVLVIKQTLYRMGPDSPLVDYLIDAARAGKEVTAVVELRARFDEEANINVATRLQEAGAHVVYGVVGFKTHGKMLMVVRREGSKLRRYIHLGTGNYHAKTARLYTDLGLFTCDQEMGEDIHKLFMQLTGLGRVSKLEKCLQSPFTLQASLQEKIKREMQHVADGRQGKIICKMNSLTDPQMIQYLYEASKAGVQIDLIVRGICCLLPEVAGLSENIRVRSIVGRFLEHTRVYYFHNDGDSEVFLASADLMTRNLAQRVEIAFPIENTELKERVIEESLQYYLKDNIQSWQLTSEGTYLRNRPFENEEGLSAQMELLKSLAFERRD